MYKTVKMQLRNMTKDQYSSLRELCKLSKNMFNVALYNVKQYFLKEGKYLSYEANYPLCKENENYKMLAAQMAQQTAKVVDSSCKSFFALLKKAKQGSYKYQQIKFPKYLDKDSYFKLIIPQFKVRDGKVKLPMSIEFGKVHSPIYLTIPPHLLEKNIKEIRIHPRHNAKYFEAEFVYEDLEMKLNLNPESYLSIDFGIDNIATCVDTLGSSFIMNGRNLKSINQWYNKRKAKLSSIKDKQKFAGYTNQLYCITRKRNNQIKDAISKTAKHIINYCINNNIGNIVCGYNPTLQLKSNLGRVNNQTFVSIPFGQLREKIEYQCKFYGINFIEQEESYTSKSSFLDNDELPTYNADNPQSYSFSGKRIKRGLYRSKDGSIINSDCNGAANILRKYAVKSNQNIQMDKLTRGRMDRPVRIRCK